MKRFVWLQLLCLFTALPAAAHEVGEAAEEVPHSFHELWRTWGFEPGSIIGIVLVGGLYAIGVAKMWRANRVGHGIKQWEAWCFAGGWFTLIVALISPLHPWGQVLFSAHMVQHELLMLIAAPLLVLGRPMAAMLRALPGGLSHLLGRFSNTPGWSGFWGSISNPFSACVIHLIVLWGWHAPKLFQATLHSEWIHAAQHVSFLGSALLFWWALIHGRRHAAAYGVGVLYLFTTALHSGLLGALLTFARTVWYPHYIETTGEWGLSALQDQQIGGLIMWVPACTVYIFAGLAMFAAWLRESERRVAQREMRSAIPEGGDMKHFLVVLFILVLAGCDSQAKKEARAITGGDPDRGEAAIDQYGCSSCHTIPGIRGADALVGPSLKQIASRTYIGGVMQNTPRNMVTWIKNAPGVDPKTAMPNLHVTENDARDIACYLYTLQ